VEVGIGAAVSVGVGTVTAGAHEARIKAASKTGMMFLIFIDHILFKNLVEKAQPSTLVRGVFARSVVNCPVA
jgi:hypothetical protein